MICISCHSLIIELVHLVLCHILPLSCIMNFERYQYLFRFRTKWRAEKKKGMMSLGIMQHE